MLTKKKMTGLRFIVFGIFLTLASAAIRIGNGVHLRIVPTLK